jgi:AcrR family transcriptional regulator
VADVTTDTRAKILGAGARLFTREGFHVVGVDRVAREAGVSKRTLYAYFPTKEELLRAVLRDAGPSITAAVLPDGDDGTPGERIRAVFTRQRELAARPSFTGCPFVALANELRNPRTPATKIAARLKLGLTAFFAEQAARAEAEDADVLAEQLTVLWDGANSYVLLHGRYPQSTFAAVDALLAAHGVAPAQ